MERASRLVDTCCANARRGTVAGRGARRLGAGERRGRPTVWRVLDRQGQSARRMEPAWLRRRGAPHARAVWVEAQPNAAFLCCGLQAGSAETRSPADTSEGAGLPASEGAGLPAFALDATGGARSARALPIVVGGAAGGGPVADHPAGGAHDTGRWSLTLDVLARHASKVLEGLTVQQALGLSLPAHMARASHDAVAGLSHDRSVQ